jgi:hypothetical protein
MTSPALPPALTSLAKTIITLQNRIAQLERNQRASQLSSTSIEGGTLTVNDPTGNPAVVLGVQSDGSVTAQTISSYLPPQTPSTPTALAGVLSVWVVWDGQMAGSAAPLLDFQAVQVHCSTVSGFTPSAATLAGTMHGAGLFTVGQLTGGTTYYVALVAINDAGTTGTPSPQASAVAATVAQNIAAGDITADLLAAGIVYAGIVDATTITAAEFLGAEIVGAQIGGGEITGAQIVGAGSDGQFLIYEGAPATGNLIGSWSGAPGADVSANPYPAGLGIGVNTGPQVVLSTEAAAAELQFPSNAADETIAGSLVGSVENAGAVNQYLQLLLTGPAGTGNNGNCFTVSMNSDADDSSGEAELVVYDNEGIAYLAMANTGSPQMFLGTQPGGGASFLPITLSGALLGYGSAGQLYTKTYTSPVGSSFTIPIPAGVATANVECLGAGAGGQAFSGPGGGSGEYAAEPALAVTTAGITAFIGAGGTGGTSGSSGAGGVGGNTTAAGTSVTVHAHGAPANNATGGGLRTSLGGSSSINTTHRNGSTASSYDGSTNGGGGGAGAPSVSHGGGAGLPNYTTQPGTGGAAGAGSFGGPGGGGGWGSATALSGTSSGASGYGTGSGGGAGGSYLSTNGGNGGAGTGGAIRVTYTLPGVTGIDASMASAAGTDPSGNTFPAGFQGQIVAVKPGTSPSVPEVPHSLPLVTATWTVLAGGYLSQYYLLPNGRLQVDFELTASGLAGGNYPVTTALPAAYRPAHPQTGPITWNATSAAGTNAPCLSIATNGILTAGSLPAGTTLITFSGSFPLT